MSTTSIAARRRRLTLAGAAALAAALSTMLGLAMSPASAQADSWDYLMPAPGACGPAESNAYADINEQKKAGACLANAVRQNYGRTRLSEGIGNGYLSIAAYFKGRDIMTCQTGDPHYACGKPMDYWLKRYHYDTSGGCTSGFAENIYKGWGSPYNTVREAVRVWVNSQIHRDNLLSPTWRQQALNRYGPGTWQGNANTVIWVHYMC